MESDDHYYVAGYSAEDDPYALPSGVLINKLQLTTTRDIEAAESVFIPIRSLELWEQPVQGVYDLAHLQAIHLHLFQDIYPWAGELRLVDIAKNDTLFLTHTRIQPDATILLAELAAEDYLRRTPVNTFSARIAWYMGRLNDLHPFREGNGRTQREFIGQLARDAGYVIEWAGCSKESMKQACIAAGINDYGPLTRIIQVGLKPVGKQR
jgi:cell filamentation protein